MKKEMTYDEYCEKYDSLKAKQRQYEVLSLLGIIAFAISLLASFIIGTTYQEMILAVAWSMWCYIYHADKSRGVESDIRRLNYDFDKDTSND